MSDHESLGDASWAANFLTLDDFVDLQTTGEAISKGDECFVLQIVKPTEETVQLCMDYYAASIDEASPEQLESVNNFFYQVVSAFYALAVDGGLIERRFWEKD